MRNSILHYGVPSVSLCSKMKYFCGVLLQISNLHSRLWHLPKTAAKKYRTWKTREYQRLRCEVRFEENKLLLLLLLLLLLVLVFMYALLYGCHAEGVNRRHRGALCSAYVGRAVRCACGSSPAPEPRVLYYDCYFAETNEAQEEQRYSSSSRQSIRRCHRYCSRILSVFAHIMATCLCQPRVDTALPYGLCVCERYLDFSVVVMVCHTITTTAEAESCSHHTSHRESAISRQACPAC